MAAALALIFAPLAQAAPTGGQVVSGAGSISQSANITTVKQNSRNLALNWQSFNIAPQETVNFLQPSASAIAVNRIFDANGSKILGRLNANGQVWLLNPNGILFGQGAEVNVGGLVASTLDINDADLGGSAITFSGNGTGRIINQGTIDGHYVALIGNTVGNRGTITANLGAVALGAGNAVALTFSGLDLVKMQVDRSLLNSQAENGGLIQADGGYVIMTAGAKDALLASVVNNTGIIEARTVDNRNGTITLLGGVTAGTANVGGTLDASAPNSGDGGFIETSAAHVKIADGTGISTVAPAGRSGNWLIDPYDFTIAATGGDITGAALGAALGTGAVTIQTAAGSVACTGATCGAGNAAGNGDIFVNDAVSWSSHLLTLSAYRNIAIKANLNGSGTASLALEYGQGAVNAGNTSTYTLRNGAQVSLPAGSNFSAKLGSDGATNAYTVITSLGTSASSSDGTLQGMVGALGGNYALGANIAASTTNTWNAGAGFTPVGTSVSNFTGIFDGLGHTVTGLTISRAGTDYQGLFGYTTGTLRNVGLVNSSISGLNGVGALAGLSGGAILYSYADGGSVTGANNAVGGLAGGGAGSISYSYANVSVSGGNTATGGLAGVAGVVSNSYATGSVHGVTDSVGGLLGQANGNISNSYATGAVSGSASHIGGLVGQVGAITTSNSYWNKASTGQNASAAGTGVDTTALMQTQATFTGFDFTATPVWSIYAGHTYPLLASFLTPLTVTANNASATYSGAAQTGSGGVSYSVTPNANLLGTVSYSGGGTNVGSYTITPSGLYSNQKGYNINYANGTLTINPGTIAVTVSGTAVADKIYDGTTTATLTGGVPSVSGVTLTQAGTFAQPNAGNGIAVTANDSISGSTGNPNYVYALIQPTGLVAAITPAPLTVTGLSGTNRTYNGSTVDALTGTASLSGLINGQSLTLGNTAGGTLASANAGSEPVTTAITIADGTGLASNYVLTQPTLDATISPATLTYVAAPASFLNGQTPAGLTGTVTGFVTGETLAGSTTGSPAWSTTATAASPPGQYAVGGGGLSATNYVFAQATGNDAALTLKPNIPPGPVLDAMAQLESSGDSTAPGLPAANVPLHVVEPGVKLPDNLF